MPNDSLNIYLEIGVNIILRQKYTTVAHCTIQFVSQIIIVVFEKTSADRGDGLKIKKTVNCMSSSKLKEINFDKTFFKPVKHTKSHSCWFKIRIGTEIHTHFHFIILHINWQDIFIFIMICATQVRNIFHLNNSLRH